MQRDENKGFRIALSLVLSAFIVTSALTYYDAWPDIVIGGICDKSGKAGQVTIVECGPR